MKLKIVLFFLLFLLLVFLGYSYVYKNHRDIASETVIKVSTDKLLSEFKENETNANQKYLDKVIQIEGKITQLDTEENFCTVNERLFASFEKMGGLNVKLNSIVILKGRFIGYDNLLEELKMDNCITVD